MRQFHRTLSPLPGIFFFPPEDCTVLGTTSQLGMNRGIGDFSTAGLDFAKAYGYGMKEGNKAVFNVRDRLCGNASCGDNKFDLGRTWRVDLVVLFRIPTQKEGAEWGVRVMGMIYKQHYPLFKHLGQEFEAVEFRHREFSVKIYQTWNHWIKASLSSDVMIPLTYGSTISFRDKYRVLVHDLSSVEECYSVVKCFEVYQLYI